MGNTKERFIEEGTYIKEENPNIYLLKELPKNHLKIKQSGQIFTPYFLVNSILDYIGYTSGNIRKKHIIDNSCGDGAFLCEIVNRYCIVLITLQRKA